MKRDAAETRLPPRERFDGSGHFFELPAIAAGLRDEREPVAIVVGLLDRGRDSWTWVKPVVHLDRELPREPRP